MRLKKWKELKSLKQQREILNWAGFVRARTNNSSKMKIAPSTIKGNAFLNLIWTLRWFMTSRDPHDFWILDNDIIIEESETLYLDKPFSHNTTPHSDGQTWREAKKKGNLKGKTLFLLIKNKGITFDSFGDSPLASDTSIGFSATILT